MMRLLGLILMTSALVACGDDEAGDDDDDVVTIDAAVGAIDAPAADIDAAGGGVDAAGVDAAGVDAGGGAFATFTAVQGTGDCMPIVPPDPMGVSFTVLFDNTAGASIAKIVVSEVELTWDDGAGMVATQKISVSPAATTVAAGATKPETFTKTAALDDLASDCSYCGGTVKVSLSVVINGGDVQVFTSDTGDVSCTF